MGSFRKQELENSFFELESWKESKLERNKILNLGDIS